MLSLYLWFLSLTFIKGPSKLSVKSKKPKQKDRLTQSSVFGITNQAIESQNQEQRELLQRAPQVPLWQRNWKEDLRQKEASLAASRDFTRGEGWDPVGYYKQSIDENDLQIWSKLRGALLMAVVKARMGAARELC